MGGRGRGGQMVGYTAPTAAVRAWWQERAPTVPKKDAARWWLVVEAVVMMTPPVSVSPGL